MDKKDILTQINHDDGMRVPDNFFADFEARMSESLPVLPWEEADAESVAPAPSMWQRIRPYVYMAAMFAGIWLVMHMFSIGGSHNAPDAALADNPVLAEALGDAGYVESLNIYDGGDESTQDLYDIMYSEGVTVEDLRADLDKRNIN